MTSATYTDYLVEHPKYFDAYKKIVNHTPDCYDLLCQLNLIHNVHSLLSIGAGEGDLEIELAQRHGISIGYLDPSASAQRHFHSAIQQQNLQPLLREVFCGRFEDYHSSLQYDLVIAVHSWYAFGYNEDILRKALASLKENGVLFIIVESRNSLGYDLASFSTMPGMILNAEDFSAWATAQGYAHEYHEYYKPLPFSLFVRDGQISKQGRCYVSFLATTPWDQLSHTTQKDILELFHKHRRDNSIDIQCGCLAFRRGQ